jgi:hypothetical protein
LDLFDSKSASDVHRRTIAAGHHPVMVTLVEQECGEPVPPSTRFSWPHFSGADVNFRVIRVFRG